MESSRLNANALKRRTLYRRPLMKSYNKKLTKVMKEQVKGIVSKTEELKYIDLVIGPTTITSTASFSLMSAITQGVLVSNRIGNEIKLRKIELRYHIYGSSAGDFTNLVRVMIVMDRQANAAIFGINDLLAFGGDTLSPYNEDNTKRFKMIQDRTHALENVAGVAQIYRHKVIRLKGKVFFTGAGNTIANIKTNSIYVVLLSDSVVATHPNFEGIFRLWYSDS